MSKELRGSQKQSFEKSQKVILLQQDSVTSHTNLRMFAETTLQNC